MFNTSILYVGNEILFDPLSLDATVIETYRHVDDTFDDDLAKLYTRLALLERRRSYGLRVASNRGIPIAANCQIPVKGTSMQGKRHAEKADVSCNNINRTKRSKCYKHEVMAPHKTSVIRGSSSAADENGQWRNKVVTSKVVIPETVLRINAGQSPRSIATARLIFNR